MASDSHSSRHKSRLLREMSRELNRSSHSVASSTGSNHGTVSTDSTMTDFNPDKDEAIMSTRQLDNNYSQKLPELRNTAKKYGRWAPREQQDFVINTSAIGRAFPDFSQGGSSDDSMSIEVGRGVKRTPTRSSRIDYSDNVNSSPVVTIGNVHILGTPKRPQAKPSILQDALRNSVSKRDIVQKRDTGSHKENIPPLNAPKSANSSPYISHASRTTSGERRTLAELHAKVADESNGSIIGDERPVTVTFQAKSTRFSNSKPYGAQPANISSRRQDLEEALVENLRTASGTPSKPQAKITTHQTASSTTPNPTQQSFLLPNMPEISDVVSSSFNNGAQASVRGGLGVSLSRSGTSTNFPRDTVDGIPLPEDEKNIYMNIDLLKEKYAKVESELADSNRIRDDLQEELQHVQDELDELMKRHRADSALGMTDSGGDACSASRKKFKLQAEVTSLQTLLKHQEQTASLQERHLETVLQERDQAVQRISELKLENQQLQVDNEDLIHENNILRHEIARFASEADGSTHTWRKQEDRLREEIESLKKQLTSSLSESKENARDWRNKEEMLRNRLQRQDQVVREMQEMTQEIRQTTREIRVTSTNKGESTKRRSSNDKRKSNNRASEQELVAKVVEQAQKQLEQIKSASAEHSSSRGRRPSGQILEVKLAEPYVRQRSRSQSRRRSENIETKTQNTHEQAIWEQQIQDNDASDEGSFDEGTTVDTTIHKSVEITANQENPTIDTEDGSDYASIVGPEFMKDLRRQVKEAREAKMATAAPTQDETLQSVRSSRAPSVKGLTGILKNLGTRSQEDLTGRFSVKLSSRIEEDDNVRSNASHRRHHSESSVHNGSTRRRQETEDMTSAFIIPDISSNQITKGAEHPSLSANARRVLDGLCKHDCKNCTVCTRVASFNSKKTAKSTVHISKPIPVSERMPVPGPYEDEPTLRPSVDPGLALATVIKDLEDEVAHLKIEHTKILAAYNKHDSSLGMRQRKSLKKRLDELLRAIEIKSDQIYALYDVVEGQKQSGQEMTEKDVEVTLLSIGVDPEELTKGSNRGSQKKHSEKDDDEDSELDLPWEGIEDTIESLCGRKRSKSHISL